MIEEPFTGFKGQHIEMPPRNVVPKPLQKPHPAGVGRLHPAGVGADGRAERPRRTEFRLHRTRPADGASQRLLQGVRGERRSRHATDEPEHPRDRRRPLDDGGPHRRAGHRTARHGRRVLRVRDHALLHDRHAHAGTDRGVEAASRGDRERSERRLRSGPRAYRQPGHGARVPARLRGERRRRTDHCCSPRAATRRRWNPSS